MNFGSSVSKKGEACARCLLCYFSQFHQLMPLENMQRQLVGSCCQSLPSSSLFLIRRLLISSPSRWPATVVGKFNLVEAPTKRRPPWFSTAQLCQVNPQLQPSTAAHSLGCLPFLLTLQHVDGSHQPASRLRLGNRTNGQGMLLFKFAGQLYGPTVCQLWSPLLSLLVAAPWSLAATRCTPASCITAFNFRSKTVSLKPDKLAKLSEQIQALLTCKKTDKKTLQSCLGLPDWTTFSHYLRFYTAPLCSDLDSPARHALQHPCPRVAALLFSLDNRAVVTRTVPGLQS